MNASFKNFVFCFTPFLYIVFSSFFFFSFVFFFHISIIYTKQHHQKPPSAIHYIEINKNICFLKNLRTIILKNSPNKKNLVWKISSSIIMNYQKEVKEGFLRVKNQFLHNGYKKQFEMVGQYYQLFHNMKNQWSFIYGLCFFMTLFLNSWSVLLFYCFTMHWFIMQDRIIIPKMEAEFQLSEYQKPFFLLCTTCLFFSLLFFLLFPIFQSLIWILFVIILSHLIIEGIFPTKIV